MTNRRSYDLKSSPFEFTINNLTIIKALKPSLLLFCLLTFGIAIAQKDSIQSKSLGYSFFGQGGINPGLTFTYEKTLMHNEHFELLEAAKAGIYFHYKNNTGVFLMAQSGTRFRITKNLYFEHFLGVGYLQSFLNGGDAYYVNASGQIQKANKIGNPHFMPSISFGLSYKIKERVRVYLRPMIYWQIPFNESVLVQYAFEVGTSLKFRTK